MAKKIHDSNKCDEEDSCELEEFINEISDVVNNKKAEDFDFAEKAKFVDILKKHTKKFLVCDQIFKKFGANFYDLEENTRKLAIYFEIEKAKSFIENIERMNFLADKYIIISKLICKLKKIKQIKEVVF